MADATVDDPQPTGPAVIGRLNRMAWLPGWRSVLAVASGLLLALAFPPFESWQLAWVALVPLLIALVGVEPREGMRLGWRAGLAFWLVALVWLLRLVETSPAPAVVLILGWALLAGYCALYTAAFGLAFAWVARRVGAERYWQTLVLMGAAVVLWVGGEYVRGVLATGFPWNSVGVSQYQFLPIVQVAAWGGVAAVSGLVVFVNAGIAFTARRYLPGMPRTGYRPHVELFVVLMALGLCLRSGMGAVRLHYHRGTEFTVAGIQPAVPQVKKWEEGQAERNLAVLRRLTEAALAAEHRPDLVVWPETATPDCVTEENESRELALEMCRRGVPLLVGSMVIVPKGTEDWLCYNASLLFDAQGHQAGRYDKQHLVPFGEYVPFSGMVPALGRLAPMGWNCEAGREGTVLKGGLKGIPFACLICMEDVFPDLARAAVARGARLLINQTNDAWFDRTSGPRQHLSHSVFRAVENRVPVIRVANSGITCSIAASGAIEEETDNSGSVPPRAEAVAMTVGVPGVEWAPTPYSRHGDVLFGMPCGIAAVLVFGLVFAVPCRKSGPTQERR